MAITHGPFTGTLPMTLASPNIPAGVIFTDNTDGSFTLTGFWPATGTKTYTVNATNLAGTTSMTGNTLISTPAPVAPIFPVGGPFSDTGVAGTAI